MVTPTVLAFGKIMDVMYGFQMYRHLKMQVKSIQCEVSVDIWTLGLDILSALTQQSAHDSSFQIDIIATINHRKKWL